MGDNVIWKTGVKNVIYSILAQAIFFVLSIVTGFILPKAMGVTQYGYWQVYLFYVAYIMIFCLGFNDGLYLRYGSLNYHQLPFEKLRSAMRVFIVLISIMSCILFSFSFLERDTNKIFAFCAVSINLLILGLYGTLLSILQFTNRIKLNSILTVASKAVFCLFIIPLLFINQVDFRLIIGADILTKILLLGVIMYKSKELFIGSTQGITIGFGEYWGNVKVGFNLVIANILSLLLVGVGRFIVERYMSIETYGLYSFATTIAFFALLFINASSLALYPLLKRLPADKLPNFYVNLNSVLCLVLFIFLVSYYPFYYLIKYHFAGYSGVLEYFYLMFIIIITEGKMQFLLNTYYKVLREEKAMLVANLLGVVAALVVIVPAFYITHSIFAIVIGTIVILVLRTYASEIYLKRKMGIKGYGNIIVELAMMLLFIACVLFADTIRGFAIYIFVVGLYAFVNRTILKSYTSKIFRLATKK